MTDFLAQAFVLGGSLFILLAAIGVTRMPDLYMRMSTVTKGATLGLGLILIGVVIALFSVDVLVKALAVILFGFATSPVAAHMISRAAYFQGVALWEGTILDELRGQYEDRTHVLHSPEPDETAAAVVLESQGEESQTFDD